MRYFTNNPQIDLLRGVIQLVDCRSGATDDDLDNLSTLTMSLEGVRCGIILTQNKKDKAYKVSVRSHRPADASRICQNFGGGGHPRAAGCTLDMPAREACEALMAAAAEELAKW